MTRMSHISYPLQISIRDFDFQIGVVTYSNNASVAFYLNDYYNAADIKKAIDDMPWLDGKTNTSGGMTIC